MYIITTTLRGSIMGRIRAGRQTTRGAFFPGGHSNARSSATQSAHAQPGDRPSDVVAQDSQGSVGPEVMPEPLPRRVKRPPAQPAQPSPPAPLPSRSALASDLLTTNGKAPVPGDDATDAARSRAYLFPLAGGAAALVLGWIAESIVRSHNTTPISLLLYLVVSPNMAPIRASFGESMKDPVARFWAVEHLTAMLAAVILAHVGRVLARKAKTPDALRLRLLVCFGLATVLMILGMPWPGRPGGRPLLRI